MPGTPSRPERATAVSRTKKGVLAQGQFEKVGKDDKGAQPALIVSGEDTGKVIHVRVKRESVKPQAAAQPSAAEREVLLNL